MLYVEDDEILAHVTMQALRRRGFEVIHFADFDAAAQAIRTQGFACALLDLRLGCTSSLPLLEMLLLRNPDVKAVLLTGYASIATAVQAIKIGAINYLTKPATITEILSAFDFDADAVDEELNAAPSESLSLKRLEWERIQQALLENNGNISATARQLKMHRRTLQRKLDKKPVKS